MGKHRVTDIKATVGPAGVLIQPMTRSSRGARALVPGASFFVARVAGKLPQGAVASGVQGLYPPPTTIEP